ncbi:MAG: DinB family protein [Flavobacteriaceae bacterium]
MKKISLLFALLCLTFVSAQDEMVQQSVTALLSNNQGQITSLAEAFPADKYDWRPAEGIRSVGESLLHVAGGNYYIASKLGFAPPEDVDMMNIEKIQGKENIIAALTKSFEFVKDKLGTVETSTLGNEVDLGFAKANVLSTMLIILEHSGEHKGQLIAYARSNDVVPPWSK